MTPNFRLYVGPLIRLISVDTEPTDEATFTGQPFSNLEFDDYTNIGGVVGFDYIYSFNEKIFMTFGLDAQFDTSSSDKIPGSDFIGTIGSIGLGFGIRIGVYSKEDSSLLDDN